METKVIKVKAEFGNRRTARYRLPQAVAKKMFESRGPADKGTPFNIYISKCVADSGLLYPVSEIELY